MLVWPQIVFPPQVVEEFVGSGVGAQLLNPGLSELCHPGDCLMGLQNHAGQRKQYGKFVLPGFMEHMSCGIGSGLGSTLYTSHQHHVAPKFCADVVFRRLVFLSPMVLWVWRCNQRVRSYGLRMTYEGGGARCAACLGYLGTTAECGTKGAKGNLGPSRLDQK